EVLAERIEDEVFADTEHLVEPFLGPEILGLARSGGDLDSDAGRHLLLPELVNAPVVIPDDPRLHGGRRGTFDLRWIHTEGLSDSSSGPALVSVASGLGRDNEGRRREAGRVIRCSTGEVARVVTRAIRTIIANRVGEMTFRSRPMLRTTSSSRPRVFIRIPRAAASRGEEPVERAARKVPPNLPAEATRMMTPHTSHCSAPWTRPIWVRIPVEAK